ncbi:hypothetical protein L6452_15127 [Arctium lappa]|uniref:Uncharacterized protein n=1 Tax=Arctium lappa TaxID=4217 RepID=A0ACB9CN43_ARCLA|nr:hypothetical protein L6452_15127 [Arctium lappa]
MVISAERFLNQFLFNLVLVPGISFYKGVADSLKKTNELLNLEVPKWYRQVDSLRHQYDSQEIELQKSRNKAQEAMILVAEESAKSKAAKDVIKSLTAQLKDMAERLPPGFYDFESIRSANGLEQNGVLHFVDAIGALIRHIQDQFKAKAGKSESLTMLLQMRQY